VGLESRPSRTRGQWEKTYYVAAQDNAFTGNIPVGRSNMALHILRARNNYFSGTIPDPFWELPQLVTVDFSNNS
jgi:hypothetical protein